MNYTELDWRWAILLGAALRDGLLEAVAERPSSSADVAGDLGLDARAVHVVLSALAELGVLVEGDDGFLLGEEHRGPLLVAEHPEYVGQSVVHRFELMGSWSRLPEVLRTGRPIEDRTAPDFGGAATFIAAMRRGAMPGAEAVAASVLPRLPEGARILDVGGGPGTNAEAFARGGARVTVLDRPVVIDLMRSTLHAAGVETVAGDMNEGLPEGPFDAVYFGNTSHMYGPRENLALLARMRGSLAPAGLLVVREFVRGLGEDAALFAVNMLVTTARGNTYTAEEYEGWLARAGYEGVEFEPVPGRSTHLIFARKTRPTSTEEPARA
ncbi:class I SAM-dependent methyltransferase [Rubrobacter tropicus]|uniref:class I SAM-dependent methyltransferase n=1 Tax=Rubrobacter tropicus TaxID=2653851 RepID=UPI00140D7A60|nr:class I SAM-dependent methyltransferase [Rubrobacter tropicus]